MTLERTLHRDYYLADEVFALERERIFAREWVCVGREEELAAPGDWVTRDPAPASTRRMRWTSGTW